MKKIFAAIISAVLILSIIPSAVFADFSGTLAAESDGATVTLSWEKASGAKEYTVYYRRAGTDDFKSLGTFGSLKLKVKKLTSGAEYEFKVRSDSGEETPVLNITPETGKKKSATASDSDGFESAADAVKNMGAGINIGNSFDSCGSWLPKNATVKQFEEAWGNPQITKAHVEALKDAGFGAVRLPITWNYVSDEKGNIRKDWLDRVQKVVDWILDEGMYCIINVHHDTGTEGWIHASESSYKNGNARFANIWKQVAERFKDYGEKLLFESMNETLNDSNDWNSKNTNDFKIITKWHQKFIDTIRATGGNNAVRNIVVNTYAGSSSDYSINNFELPNDTVSGHMIMEVHNYDPQGFTWKNVGYDTERSEWGTAQEKKNMEHFISTLAARAKKLGVPAIVGEFSSDNKNNESERAEHAEYMYKTAGKSGIAVFWWDNGDHNGCRIFDRTTGKITMPKIVEAIIGATK